MENFYYRLFLRKTNMSSTAYAKAKGRALQNWTRDLIYVTFKDLETRDVKCAIMGESGVDIQLSTYAQKLFPWCVEAKARKAIAVYEFFKQAQDNCNGGEPLLIIKANNQRPLAVLDAELFLRMQEYLTPEQHQLMRDKVNFNANKKNKGKF